MADLLTAPSNETALSTVPKLILLAVLFVLWPLNVSAAAATPASGITVAPALLTAQIGSKQPQTSVTIGVRNNFEVPVTVSAELNGFDVRNNALVPTVNAEKTLAGVVSLSPAEIVIEPGTSKNITVLVKDTPNLAPGGHYLSILLTETAVTGQIGTSQLALKPAVSATLYVIKEDGAVRNLQARSLQLQHSLFSLPKKADVTFFNTGNVALIPRGIVRLGPVKPAALAISQGVINQQSAPLYPQASITLQAQLQKVAATFLPGRYQAGLEYRYDSQESSQQLTTSFWYIPKIFVLTVLWLATAVSIGLWPANQRRIRRWWQRIRRPKAKAYVVPDAAKIGQNRRSVNGQDAVQKQPVQKRRKIDDIKKL